MHSQLGDRVSDLPAPPGQSPFKAKGVLYTGARQFYDRRVPGGCQAVGEHIQDDDLRAFFEQLFVSAGTYDILPLEPISAAAAKAAGVPHRQLVEENARWMAKRDIHGVFRLLLKVSSPKNVALRLPRAAMQYFKFGEAEGSLGQSGQVQAVFRGIPSMLANWFEWAAAGFCPVALEMAGASRPAITRTRKPVRDGEVGGIPTMALQWSISW